MFRSIVVVVLLAALSLVAAAPTARDYIAPYYPASQYPIEDSYIVRLKDGYSLADHLNYIPGLEEADTDLLEMPFGWGYAANIDLVLLDLVRRDEGVEFVEQNSGGEWTDAQSIPDFDLANTTLERSNSTLEERGQDQNVGYGLLYLSAKSKHPTASDGYQFLDNSGSDVDLYIMDTGINSRSEFGYRVQNIINYSDEGYKDFAGHGTQVAGCAGSNTYGTAKKPDLLNVKFAIGGSPNASKWMKAMGDIISRHNSRKTQSGFKGSIINMSFNIGASQAASQTLENAMNAGISMVAAAGNGDNNNNGVNARNTFPCNDDHVICVGASTQGYKLASFSNYGQAVDFIAPGEAINTVPASGKAPIQNSGTSFATPYVSGILAIFYGYEGPSLTPAMARTRLGQNADAYLENLPNTQINRLANTGYRKASNGKPYLGI